MDKFNNLPNELCNIIASFLPAHDILLLSFSCKNLHRVINSEDGSNSCWWEVCRRRVACLLSLHKRNVRVKIAESHNILTYQVCAMLLCNQHPFPTGVVEGSRRLDKIGKKHKNIQFAQTEETRLYHQTHSDDDAIADVLINQAAQGLDQTITANAPLFGSQPIDFGEKPWKFDEEEVHRNANEPSTLRQLLGPKIYPVRDTSLDSGTPSSENFQMGFRLQLEYGGYFEVDILDTKSDIFDKVHILSDPPKAKTEWLAGRKLRKVVSEVYDPSVSDTVDSLLWISKWQHVLRRYITQCYSSLTPDQAMRNIQVLLREEYRLCQHRHEAISLVKRSHRTRQTYFGQPFESSYSGCYLRCWLTVSALGLAKFLAATPMQFDEPTQAAGQPVSTDPWIPNGTESDLTVESFQSLVLKALVDQLQSPVDSEESTRNEHTPFGVFTDIIASEIFENHEIDDDGYVTLATGHDFKGSRAAFLNLVSGTVHREQSGDWKVTTTLPSVDYSQYISVSKHRDTLTEEMEEDSYYKAALQHFGSEYDQLNQAFLEARETSTLSRAEYLEILRPIPREVLVKNEDCFSFLHIDRSSPESSGEPGATCQESPGEPESTCHKSSGEPGSTLNESSTAAAPGCIADAPSQEPSPGCTDDIQKQGVGSSVVNTESHVSTRDNSEDESSDCSDDTSDEDSSSDDESESDSEVEFSTLDDDESEYDSDASFADDFHRFNEHGDNAEYFFEYESEDDAWEFSSDDSLGISDDEPHPFAPVNFYDTPCVAIGLVGPRTKVFSKQPGWEKGTIGLHGDDGNLFAGRSTNGYRFSPLFQENQTVGCGFFAVERGELFVYFTMNGEIIDSKVIQVTRENYMDLDNTVLDLLPAIGLDSQVPLRLNFGTVRPFKYRKTGKQHDAVISQVKLLLRKRNTSVSTAVFQLVQYWGNTFTKRTLSTERETMLGMKVEAKVPQGWI